MRAVSGPAVATNRPPGLKAMLPAPPGTKIFRAPVRASTIHISPWSSSGRIPESSPIPPSSATRPSSATAPTTDLSKSEDRLGFRAGSPACQRHTRASPPRPRITTASPRGLNSWLRSGERTRASAPRLPVRASKVQATPSLETVSTRRPSREKRAATTGAEPDRITSRSSPRLASTILAVPSLLAGRSAGRSDRRPRR